MTIEHCACWTFTSIPASIPRASSYVISRAAHSSVSESASMCLDRLELDDRLAELHALLRERGRLLDQPLDRAAAASRDHQALVAEPLVRERHPVALGADQMGGRARARPRRRRSRGVSGVGVRCSAARGPAGRPGCPCRRRTSRARPRVGRPRASPGRSSTSACCTTSRALRAVQDVVVAVAPRGRLDRVDVGAGALLGDRVALVAFAAHGRRDPAFDLLRRATAGAHAGGVWTHQPSALVTRPICSDTRTCWKIENPPPPRSFGMFIANRPSSFAFAR